MKNGTVTLDRELAGRLLYYMRLSYDDMPTIRELEAALAEPVPQSVGDWAIDTTAGRPILVYKGCSVLEDEQAHYVLRLIKNNLIEPVPTAVDKVETLALVHRYDLIQWFGRAWRTTPPGTELVDRAHVTRLQAEVERLKSETRRTVVHPGCCRNSDECGDCSYHPEDGA
jgi:hypothetical protein